jgi:hypothetical protein
VSDSFFTTDLNQKRCDVVQVCEIESLAPTLGDVGAATVVVAAVVLQDVTQHGEVRLQGCISLAVDLGKFKMSGHAHA